MDEEIEKLNFGENNWFDFLYTNLKTNIFDDVEGDERFTYSDALKAAKQYLNDDEFWEQF